MNPDQVEQAAKVMRIGAMVHKLIQEVRLVPLDQAGRDRLAEIRRRSIGELKQDGLSPELIDKLERITLSFNDNATSEAERRAAQVQLDHWLEGVFHRSQTAYFAEQMAAQQHLQSLVDVAAATARLHEGAPPPRRPSRAHLGG